MTNSRTRRKQMDLQLIDKLAQLLGERFTTGDYECQQHGKDESSFRPMPPEAVCFPRRKLLPLSNYASNIRLPLFPLEPEPHSRATSSPRTAEFQWTSPA
jgi:hypothetical protein